MAATRYTARVDNITHTLAGLVVAEAALAVRRARGGETPAGLVRAAWVTSAIGNNLPDADMLLSPLIESPLGYLLHHRGHTHTLVLAPLLGAIAWLFGSRFARKPGWPPHRRDHVFLFALGTLGPVVHVAMDATNSYGVHPFWPFDDRWYAGDLIFIVEPLWWVALALPLSFSVQAPRGRYALWGIAALGLLLAVVTGLVSSLAIAWLCALGAGTFFFARRLKTDGGRATLSIVLTALMLLGFATGRSVAEGRVRTALNGAFSHSIEADLILSPEPANPLCWSAMAVSEERGDLVLRRAHVSAGSTIHPVGLCRMPFPSETTAERTAIARSETEDVRFGDEVRSSLARLRALNGDCRVSAFLRFARAPYVLERGDVIHIGDLRFDREADNGFAEMDLSPDRTGCPSNVPPWAPWRADVLSGPLPEEIHRHEDLDI